MNQSDQIRRKAAEAQKWADEAMNEYDRSARLHIAEGWLELIHPPRRSSKVEVEEPRLLGARRTGQWS